MTEQSENTTETSTQPTAELNINDLATLKAAVDLAATRGAYKAEEMAAVGNVYNKLAAFLEQVSKQATANNPEGV
jgi:hypothetical protein